MDLATVFWSLSQGQEKAPDVDQVLLELRSPDLLALIKLLETCKFFCPIHVEKLGTEKWFERERTRGWPQRGPSLSFKIRRIPSDPIMFDLRYSTSSIKWIYDPEGENLHIYEYNFDDQMGELGIADLDTGFTDLFWLKLIDEIYSISWYCEHC